jgi:hypothetical protein
MHLNCTSVSLNSIAPWPEHQPAEHLTMNRYTRRISTSAEPRFAGQAPAQEFGTAQVRGGVDPVRAIEGDEFLSQRT